MALQSDMSVRKPLISGLLGKHRLLLTLVLGHLGAALMLSAATGVPFESGAVPTLLTLLLILVPVFIILLTFWRFGWMAITVRPERPIHWFLSDLRAILLDPERMLGGVLALLAISLFAGTFAYFKDMIPVVIPYSWDPIFAEWDRVLHGGKDPWTLLLPLFGSPFMTTALNAAYHFWFFLLYFLVFMACFDMRAPRRSMTFLVAFVLAWAINGNLMATLFSSVGPVYFSAFGFGETFSPLVERLHAVAEISPVWALDVHEMLLDGFQNDGPMKGISAMPSMHVGSCVIMTLYCFSLRKWLGWMMVAFTTLIQIGSVHLAWHYAIDGYFAIVICACCWWLAKWLTIRFCPVS